MLRLGVQVARVSATDGYATFTPVSAGGYTIRGHQVWLPADARQRSFRSTSMSASWCASRLPVPVYLDGGSSGTAEIVQSEDGSLGQVIGGNVAVELPLAGRRYTELALLVPGATESTLDPTTRGTGWFVANGNYQTQNNFTVDGVDNNQGTTNAQSLSAQVVQPSPDAIGEFKVQTNSYSAEFGRSAGAVVNVVLQVGHQSHARIGLVLQPR